MKDNDSAEASLDRAIYFAKKILNKDGRIETVCNAFQTKGTNFSAHSKFEQAKEIYTEAYIVASETYNASHPIVLQVARWLIEVLIKKEEYYCDAERYARICYECVLEQDPNSEATAESALLLSRATYNHSEWR